MKQIKILVFSAAFGNGHRRAAEAVIEELQRREPGAIVNHLDFGDFLSKRFNWMAKKLYFELTKYSPKLWGKFYYKTSKLQPSSGIRSFLNRLGRNDFLRCIREFEPDLLVCTHPTVSSILAELRLELILQIPVVSVITDYEVHSHWIHPGVDSYIAACPDTKEILTAQGIPAWKIQVTGIPVSPKFSGQMDRENLRAKLGPRTGTPTFLVMGAYGNGKSTKRICRELAASQVPVQLILVCGNNKKLYSSMQEVAQKSRNTIKLLGYADNIEELMAAADLIITKAGGLTVTEALTMHLPLLIYKPIPGQEVENASYVQKIGAGQVAATEKELVGLLKRILRCPEEIERMREKAFLALPGHSAGRTVDIMLQIIRDEAETKRRIS